MADWTCDSTADIAGKERRADLARHGASGLLLQIENGGTSPAGNDVLGHRAAEPRRAAGDHRQAFLNVHERAAAT